MITKPKVALSATVSVEMTEEEARTWLFLCEYGDGFIKAVREKVTGQVSEEVLKRVVDGTLRGLAPAIREMDSISKAVQAAREAHRRGEA